MGIRITPIGELTPKSKVLLSGGFSGQSLVQKLQSGFLILQRRCEPVLQTVGIPWPRDLNCSVFPLHNTEQTMCMEFPEEEGYPALDTTLPPRPTKPVTTGNGRALPDPNNPSDTPPGHISGLADSPVTSVLCAGKRNPWAYRYSNSSGGCRPRCDVDNLFNTRLVTKSTLLCLD